MGRTTLLNCISTIDQVTAGNIMINGMDITKLKGKHLSRFRREELGFIFQDFNLLDTLTAFENIALALTIMKIPAREIEDRVRSIAEKLMITEVLNKYSYQMSGGTEAGGKKSLSDFFFPLSYSGGNLWNGQLYDLGYAELVLVCSSGKLLCLACCFRGIYQTEKHFEE